MSDQTYYKVSFSSNIIYRATHNSLILNPKYFGTRFDHGIILTICEKCVRFAVFSEGNNSHVKGWKHAVQLGMC